MGIEGFGRVAKRVIDVRAVVLEPSQFDPFARSNAHWYAGQGHIQPGLQKVPLIAASLIIEDSV